MIFKVFFRATKRQPMPNASNTTHFCKVLVVGGEPDLEKRIDNVIANLKADGYDEAEVDDCFNISEPTDPTGHRRVGY
ncbi:hypothetical protein [Muribaculum intestinale]|uniref:hypothetical protein n=1 Tax=Muribaculum intestinale TaxID=1796646 RepID=UPI0025A99695|nr:hypothetical protein [Muribaculum intestinale]